MAHRSIDRRAARTRAALDQAHLGLILKKGYDAVTVQDICAAANVSRSTFYAHYASKDDLKRKSLNHLRTFLVKRQTEAREAQAAEKDRSLRFSLPMLEHARDHIHMYRALTGTRGGTVALDTIRQILSDLVRNELPKTNAKDAKDPLSRELAVQYVVGAYMAVLTWWLDRGAKVPPEQIDAAVRRWATQGIMPSAC